MPRLLKYFTPSAAVLFSQYFTFLGVCSVEDPSAHHPPNCFSHLDRSFELLRMPNIPLTVFCTPSGVYELLRMPQGAAGTPAWFVSVMRHVAVGLDNIRMYMDGAIASGDYPINPVATLATVFGRLRL